MATVQVPLWPGSEADTLVQDWLHTHRHVTGTHDHKRHNARGAAQVGLHVCEQTASSLAMDASKDVLLALVVVVGLQALASAAIMLLASLGILLAVQAVLRVFERAE